MRHEPAKIVDALYITVILPAVLPKLRLNYERIEPDLLLIAWLEGKELTGANQFKAFA